MPSTNKNDQKGYPGFVISTKHNQNPEWEGPYRIALRNDGTAFEVLDAGAKVLFSNISGPACIEWARQKVEEMKRYV